MPFFKIKQLSLLKSLEDVELFKSGGFNASELKEMRKLVSENVELFKTKWNEYFDNQ